LIWIADHVFRVLNAGSVCKSRARTGEESALVPTIWGSVRLGRRWCPLGGELVRSA
jgi:hypothetical protein